MDTQDGRMRNRILVTEGQGNFVETSWDKPQCGHREISVKAIMTGICRSDIDMMMGKFGPLPLHMQGHEGLGQVVEVGESITGIKPGDYVATRGEPAYSDYYNVREGEYVVVPSADPKYILEPVACGINVVYQAYPLINVASGLGSQLLILGSGFLAWIAYQSILNYKLKFNVTVVGNSNHDLWGSVLELQSQPVGQYDVIIDLKDDNTVLDKKLLKPGGIWVLAAEKKQTIETNFSELLWNANSIVCPSPRTDQFHYCMMTARDWIEEGLLNVDRFWTKGYDRDTEWQQAFADGLNRPLGYSRGYITWN
jgi:D-arabinose 1-dehydrogenase-like Zn-dependent alcohol dehydrogenase